MNSKQKVVLGVILLIAGIFVAYYCGSELERTSWRHFGWWGGWNERHGGDETTLKMGRLLGFMMCGAGLILVVLGALDPARGSAGASSAPSSPPWPPQPLPPNPPGPATLAGSSPPPRSGQVPPPVPPKPPPTSDDPGGGAS